MARAILKGLMYGAGFAAAMTALEHLAIAARWADIVRIVYG